MKTFIEVETIQRKNKFLKKFKDGFKKLEAVGQELKKMRVQQLRYMAEWAVNNDLLIRGQTGYYKITEKGLEWISIADELAKVKAFSKLRQIQKMAPKSWRVKKKTSEKKTGGSCENNKTCHLISN